MTTPTLPGVAPAVTGHQAGAAGPRRPLVIGCDLSLTSTGVAGDGWTDRIRPPGRLRGDARLRHVRDTVVSYIRNADLVVIEGPAYRHAAMAGHEDLAGLRVLVRVYCYSHDIPYALVPPASLKQYVTGHGNASKGRVRTAVAELYGIRTEGPARYDEADAYGLAAAGLDWLGHPLAAVPEEQREALAGVQWPSREAVTGP
ncbi:hypothetical protein [Streptomyces sulphureus]|uniref:hypothetical protein n=1 Tax=Streptomyces sulphureus TaxID=47758 RepID=UPI00037AAC44|nr:hypothetical protein [Streptomyces sulphureus]